MKAHRIIYRLDYAPAYEILDRRGSVLGLCDSIPSKGAEYWVERGDTKNKNEVYAKYSNSEISYMLTVAPAVSVIEIELQSGVEHKQLADNSHLKTLMRVLTAVFEEFDIENINRAGFRTISFTDVAAADRVELFSRLFKPKWHEFANDLLGEIHDMGISLDGAKGNQKYHFKLGPYGTINKKEYTKYLSAGISLTESDNEKYSFVSDVDIYEQGFKLVNHKPSAWLLEAIDRHMEIAEKLHETLEKYSKNTD